MKINFLLASFLVFLISGQRDLCFAQEWTRFRGPNGSGVSAAAKIPAKWNDDNTIWKIDLPGEGHSSPVLWRKKLFLNSADPVTGEQMVVCVDTETGKIAWTTKYDGEKTQLHKQNSLATSTPTCDADLVYVAAATGKHFWLRALNHKGDKIWERDFGSFAGRHGFGTSPIVHNDAVYITNDQDGPSTLICVEAKSGKDRWSLPRKSAEGEQNASYATPLIYKPAHGDEQLIVNSWAYGFSSHNLKTGEMLWNKSVLVRRPVGSPVIASGLLLGTSGEGGGDNRFVALKLHDDNSAPEDAFAYDRSLAPYMPTVVAKDDNVYLWTERGIVSCIKLSTNQKLWQQRVTGNFSGSPVIAGDKLFQVSDKGEVFVLATGDKYELLAKNPLNETCRTTPAIVGNRMYVRTLTHLHCIGEK